MSKKKKVPVSVLIPVLNEIRNIEECIASVKWADDIVVIDSQSTDGTIEKAEELGARVVQFDWNGKFPKKKNWALENVDWKHNWVLILDADEHITPPLAKEISRAVRQNDGFNGYYINRRFMFMGTWLKYCGYYPSWNLRLLKHTEGRYEKLAEAGDTGSGDNEVHEHIIMNGGEKVSANLRHDMLHYAYPDIATWVEKHNRYSNWEARVLSELHESSESHLKASLFGNQLERKRWVKGVARVMPLRPQLRFFYHYVIKKGFLDGRRGYLFCKLLSFYEFLSIAKAEELKAREKS